MDGTQPLPSQNTFVYLMTNPDGSFKTDRIIISKSQSYPKIFTFKVIGSELVNSFIPIFDLDYSKSVEPDKVSQIIGAVSIFKITPDLYKKVTVNSDLSDMNVVLDSSKQTYGIIKRFLLTNPENLTNTLNEVVAYVDTYIKTQLAKYEISDDAFVTDINVAMFLMLSGKQKLYQPGVADFIEAQASNVIPPWQTKPIVQQPQKKGFFSFFHRSQPSQQNKKEKVSVSPKPKTEKAKEEIELEKEISELEKKVGKPEKTGFLKSIFEQWKEDAWESPEAHQRRVEQKNKEIEAKLKLEKEKLDLIERKQKLKKSLKGEANEEDKKDENNVNSGTDDEEQD